MNKAKRGPPSEPGTINWCLFMVAAPETGPAPTHYLEITFTHRISSLVQVTRLSCGHSGVGRGGVVWVGNKCLRGGFSSEGGRFDEHAFFPDKAIPYSHLISPRGPRIHFTASTSMCLIYPVLTNHRLTSKGCAISKEAPRQRAPLPAKWPLAQHSLLLQFKS